MRVSLPANLARSAAPRLLRLNISGAQEADASRQSWEFAPGASVPRHNQDSYAALPPELRQLIAANRERLAAGEIIPPQEILLSNRKMLLSGEQESVRFPFRPVQGHWLGLDDAG